MSTSQRPKRNVLNVEVSSPANSPSAGVNFEKLFEIKLNEMKESLKNELKQQEERIMSKLGDLSAEIANIRSEVKSIYGKNKELTVRCNNISAEMEECKSLISNLENNMVASDIIITNVPNSVEPSAVINKIKSVIGCEQLNVTKVFRTKSNDAQDSNPIIVKLNSAEERSVLFRSLANFRKSKKRQLQLNDIGHTDSRNVNIFECLSTLNRQLFKFALQFKRDKLINSVFSLRGNIFVRQQLNGQAVKIRDMKSLSNIVGGIKGAA